MEFPLTDYLQRIGLDSVPAPDWEGLRHLHHAQFFSIPFENLDIQLGQLIKLDSRSLIDKLIYKQRGGYCFELNGLLLMALEVGEPTRSTQCNWDLKPGWSMPVLAQAGQGFRC